MIEVKSLSTEKHTEAPYFLKEAPSLTMQKSHKRVRQISKMPRLQRTPTTDVHLLLWVAAQLPQGLLGLSKVHPNPHLISLLLPTLY